MKDVKKKNVEKGGEETPDSPKKKKAINEDVLSQESRDLGSKQQHDMVTHHMPEGNNVSFAPNDTAYDNTGRFPVQDVSSPYSVPHMVEALLLDMSNRNFSNMQEALDGIAKGDRFKKVSQLQMKQLTETLKQHGFDVKEPTVREYKPVRSDD